ncbi:MAG: YlmC/YmxH family sporulation protein [Oscillospiraceae bacterium]
MNTKLCELQRKEIVNVKDGTKIGFVDDAIIDIENAAVQSLVVYGRLRLFGLLGRQPDIIIPWCDIEIIGEDTILVAAEDLPKGVLRKNRWKELFGE